MARGSHKKNSKGPGAQSLNANTFSEVSRKVRDQLEQHENQLSKASSAKNGSLISGRGKKRDSYGKVKEPIKKDSPTSKKRPVPQNQGLAEEAHKLGGTDDDLKFLADIASDSEMDVSATEEVNAAPGFNKGLRRGVEDILRQLTEIPPLSDNESDVGEPGGSSDEEVSRDKNQIREKPKSASPNVLEVSRKLPKGSKLLMSPRPDWFEAIILVSGNDTTDARVEPELINDLHEHGKILLERENEGFKTTQQSSSSQSFYSTVIASGTLSDRISALTLAIQESPLHNMRSLEILIGLAKKRSRTQAVEVLRALKDLFAQGSLLPSDRKLYTFGSNPSLLQTTGAGKRNILKDSIDPVILIACTFESWLKEKYFEVLNTIEVWCNDEIEFSRSKAIRFVYDLLKEKPEQEINLLRLLTNKLGDPSKKVASQASYLFLQLMAAHPRMKMTIIRSIEADVLFRPGQSIHAKYYATITLNQTILSTNEGEVASKLLDVYFGLFIGLLKPTKKDKVSAVQASEVQKTNGSKEPKNSNGQPENERAVDIREKLTSAILTGINRAYPYTEDEAQSLPAHLDTLFKITHSSNFNTSVQALMLIQKICPAHEASADRFYRVLYESLLDPRLVTSSKHSLYLNLLFKALVADSNLRRVKAFGKRVLQIMALHQPSFICGCLFLLQELRQTFPGLGALIDQPEEHEIENGYGAGVQANGIPLRSQDYDGRKRDPEYSNAEHSCLWELVPLLGHFHPSVAVSAKHLLENDKLPGKPDLSLHTLIHFLDRFVYRNAKAGGANLRGSSLMQPLASGDSSGRLVSSGQHNQVPVNSELFWDKDRQDVAVEDAFFYQYFRMSGKTAGDKRTPKRQRTDDDDSESGESEIWKSMMDSAPDLRGLADSDDDLGMSDLESLEERSGEETDGGADLSGDSAPEYAEEEEEEDEDDSSPEPKTTVSAKAPTLNRKRLKNLPTFAAVEEYEKLIEGDGE